MNNSELWKEYKLAPTPALKKEIIMKYLNLVHYVIRKTPLSKNQILDERDFFQYGIEGLSEAVDRFDPDYGTKFETYAIQRIRGKIIDELRKLQSKFKTEEGDQTVDNYYTNLSINNQVDDEDGYTLAEVIPNDQLTQSEEVEKNEMKEILLKALKELNERDRLIISLYYYENLNYQEIAKLMNITISRVSQIHSRILKNLKSKLLVYNE
ncbi:MULTISPECIES: sigma-70 family RNA polymerase sigma factor [Ignavibacterium]|jgi:RNA polymerase sigma factor for flagellar operon FliA|uniref:sigma-70 family RNA polymerase sigma factor n=1 Tax=Ignavibacterium TaxID=795750 RepID=UPI0025BBBED3|nr:MULTISPECIES: sigma-70 family RNA polymerase sigma factor [Ignavibacterium]MBI5662695.1 sigma-70 family RNA polymerase sigma factor [Ignavibacterium album]